MRCRNEVIHFRLEEYMKANHQIKKRQIGAIAIAMITGTGLILGILLSLLCYQLGMYKDQSKKEILNNKYDLLTKYYEATIMSEINKKKDEDAVVNKKRSPTSNTACSVYGIWKLMLSQRLHICITLHLPTQRQHDLCRSQILLRSCKTTLPQIMTEQMSIYTENTLQR